MNFLQVSASFVNEDVEGAALWFDGKQQWMDGDWKIGEASSARRSNGLLLRTEVSLDLTVGGQCNVQYHACFCRTRFFAFCGNAVAQQLAHCGTAHYGSLAIRLERGEHCTVVLTLFVETAPVVLYIVAVATCCK